MANEKTPGVVHVGSSKQIAQKRPMVKDLPPRPLPPLNVSITSAHQCTPPHPHLPAQALLHPHPPAQALPHPHPPAQALPHPHLPAQTLPHPHPPAQSHDNGGSDRQAGPPIPVPPEHIDDVCASVRSGMQHAVLLDSTYGIHRRKLLTNCRSVPSLLTHLQCLFISKNIMLDGTLQSIAVLEHDALISLVIDILWIHGFYKDIDFDDPKALDGVITLAGAALYSALMEYKTGVYKRVEFSTAKAEATYRSILTYISDKIYPRAELAARFKALKAKIKERGESRLGL
ncbi:hypothetical protein F4604DRAFT_1673438 [Suillus subluteus]|nr:hypothetical protein F4604DRAFT_1673438 [Suillus subluteus]